MIRWLRVVLPRLEFFVLLIVLYGIAEGGMVIYGWSMGIHHDLSLVLLIIAACMYGTYRAAAFHPALRQDYRDWLQATPWTNRKALPLGPIHLVAQDLVLLGIVVAMAWPTLGSSALLVLPFFLLSNLIFLAISFLMTGERLFAYAVGFGFGLAIHMEDRPLELSIVALATYAIAYLGLMRQLKHFPWDLPAWVRSIQTTSDRKGGANPQDGPLGWPFGRLGPKFPGISTAPIIRFQDAVPLSLLAGWWVYVLYISLHSIHPEQNNNPAVALFYVTLTFVVVARLVIYCLGYMPPLSLAGRVITGRWIIPGYDRVFVAPLLAVLVGLGLLGGLSQLGLQPDLAASLALPASLIVCLAAGPSLCAWRLTGNHRIVAAMGTPTHVKVG